jgi:hypothetical protein
MPLMARLVTNPNQSPRLRGTETARSNRMVGGSGLRADARQALEKAAKGIRLRGTALKVRPTR